MLWVACPALSAPESGVPPQGFELMALANHTSGQVFPQNCAMVWEGL